MMGLTQMGVIKKMSDIQFIKFGEHDLPLPTRSTNGSSGYDLRSRESITILAGDWKLIKTGYRLKMPTGVEAQVRSRSGMALKHAVVVLNGIGTIDSDYEHELGVILINHGKNSFTVNVGDRIAQLVFAPIITLDDEATGVRDGGFGSTGIS
jgi:dUTP pyrophosphatase